MVIYYYPDREAGEQKNRLREIIETELRLKCRKQWNPMFTFIRTLEKFDLTWIVDEIQKESKKPWGKRYLAKLDSDTYEYRGKPSKQCTIRLYFCFYKEGVLLLLAESKTDDANLIKLATKRKQEIMGKK
ncbi:MAG: hypothetical protein CVU48_06630 [Candidatus Cloacimonetes bacterium HGW-Cloacimonetes-1]|jgi:hypothetical protein|nr:MAG: hypothetical protein CVU48_06630 [Candidatus Cloacimonetes bacterium HGW-Cloacimonetes-1]